MSRICEVRREGDGNFWRSAGICLADRRKPWHNISISSKCRISARSTQDSLIMRVLKMLPAGTPPRLTETGRRRPRPSVRVRVSPRVGPSPTLCEVCAYAGGDAFHLWGRRLAGRARGFEMASAPRRPWTGCQKGKLDEEWSAGPTAARPLGGGGAPSTDPGLQPYS